MNNLGKANVKVELMVSLPGIDREATKFNFEVTAYNWNILLIIYYCFKGFYRRHFLFSPYISIMKLPRKSLLYQK